MVGLEHNGVHPANNRVLVAGGASDLARGDCVCGVLRGGLVSEG